MILTISVSDLDDGHRAVGSSRRLVAGHGTAE